MATIKSVNKNSGSCSAVVVTVEYCRRKGSAVHSCKARTTGRPKGRKPGPK